MKLSPNRRKLISLRKDQCVLNNKTISEKFQDTLDCIKLNTRLCSVNNKNNNLKSDIEEANCLNKAKLNILVSSSNRPNEAIYSHSPSKYKVNNLNNYKTFAYNITKKSDSSVSKNRTLNQIAKISNSIGENKLNYSTGYEKHNDILNSDCLINVKKSDKISENTKNKMIKVLEINLYDNYETDKYLSKSKGIGLKACNALKNNNNQFNYRNNKISNINNCNKVNSKRCRNNTFRNKTDELLNVLSGSINSSTLENSTKIVNKTKSNFGNCSINKNIDYYNYNLNSLNNEYKKKNQSLLNSDNYIKLSLNNMKKTYNL